MRQVQYGDRSPPRQELFANSRGLSSDASDLSWQYILPGGFSLSVAKKPVEIKWLVTLPGVVYF